MIGMQAILQSTQFFAVTALAATFLGQPLARAVNRVTLVLFGEWAIFGFLLIGMFGLLLLARYLYAEERVATLIGFIAGLLMWRGFFDGPLRFFADYFNIAPIDFGGFPLGGRYALLMSSATIMIALLALYGGMNRETQCYFLRWVFRTIRWSPGLPTATATRSVARVTAMETVFVQWAISLLFLFFGGTVGMPFYGVMVLWACFLTYRLFKHRRAALAFRYAIPVSIIIWSLAEVGAFFGWYSEFWQQPLQHPWLMLVLVVLFVLMLWPMAKGFSAQASEASAS